MIFILTVCLVSSVYAEEPDGAYLLLDPKLPLVSDEMIKILSENLENIFPISSQRQNFTNPAEALYSDAGMDTVIRMETALGKRNILIFANADSVHDYSGFTKIDDEFPTDFQFTMDVTVNDVYPEKQGGCFIGFTNYGVSAFSGADGAISVQLLITGKSAEIYVRGQDKDSGEHLVLSDLNRTTSKLSIIHLTEHTYVFLNGTYAGQFHDGKAGPFQMIYGATVFTEGDTASCSFDNMLVKKVYKE